jgi:hypothetical protein
MCIEKAKILLPWGGKILSYCPVHANQLVMIGQASGNTISAKLLPPGSAELCESNQELTEEEKEFNKNFNQHFHV